MINDQSTHDPRQDAQGPRRDSVPQQSSRVKEQRGHLDLALCQGHSAHGTRLEGRDRRMKVGWQLAQDLISGTLVGALIYCILTAK